jgi:hypothetical protein
LLSSDLDTFRPEEMPERRKRRSSNLILALRYWLESTACRTGAVGLTLADSDGFLIASSLPYAHAEEVAALAPLLARPDRVGCRPVDEPFLPISIIELSSFCGRLYLCATGDDQRRDDGLRESTTGVCRIIRELVGTQTWTVPGRPCRSAGP